MRRKSPAFQFYPDDFMSSPHVLAMSNTEVGIYIKLLCIDWASNGVPARHEMMSRMTGTRPDRFAQAWEIIGRCFVERDGRMYSPRLDLERKKQAEWREKSAKGGVASGKARTKGGSVLVEPNVNTLSGIPLTVDRKPSSGKPDNRIPTAPAAKTQQLGRATCDAAWNAWNKSIGAVDYGRFRKALKPLLEGPDCPTPTDLSEAVRCWAAERMSKPSRERGFYHVNKFADQVQEYLTIGRMSWQNEDGTMTRKGELLTRPEST